MPLLLNTDRWYYLLEELSQEPNLDPLPYLLTLPIHPESELSAGSRQILSSRPDLKTVVLSLNYSTVFLVTANSKPW